MVSSTGYPIYLHSHHTPPPSHPYLPTRASFLHSLRRSYTPRQPLAEPRSGLSRPPCRRKPARARWGLRWGASRSRRGRGTARLAGGMRWGGLLSERSGTSGLCQLTLARWARGRLVRCNWLAVDFIVASSEWRVQSGAKSGVGRRGL